MVGKELKEVRKRLGLTQAALAKELGVAPNTLARWERGESSIPESAEKIVLQLATQQTSANAVSWNQVVIRDPHHRAIIQALNSKLDPDVFEACAADLLRADWPMLAPVSGGSDDGYDGAIANSGGDPFPLITTTANNVKDNLARNLKRALSGGWEIKDAIFATSRRISPGMRKKLTIVAKDLGVRLLQIYDQDWFANTLYYHSEWSKRLLNITGRPSALSVYPATRRPMLGDQVIGREKEIQQLRDIKHDCIIVGGPGSGKTFLLRALALEGRALFLVDDDRTAKSDAIRDQKPKAIIIDDAHVDEKKVVDLVQIRNEIKGDFKIIASSWPAESLNVARALHLSKSDFIQLNSIDPDTMVDIVKSAGVYGPNDLIRSIVRQAEGRPGLAATLAYLCLRGDIYEVMSGEALATQFGSIIDSKSSRILASFSLGGKIGTHPDIVASFLEMPKHELSQTISQLAAAGVVRQGNDREISVWPEAIRYILVRDIFFGGPGSLDFSPLLYKLADLKDGIETLIGARARGASIPELEELLEKHGSSHLWSEYASLGPKECDVAIKKRPELLIDMADSFLFHAPEAALPVLLDKAWKDNKGLKNSSDLSLEKIHAWSVQSSPLEVNLLKRRKILAQVTEQWWDKTHASDIAIRSMSFALDPGFDRTTSDPGRGRTITFTFGLLRNEELEEIEKLWPSILKIIRGSEIVDWSEIFSLIHKWLHPNINVNPTEESREIMRKIAHKMLKDLADFSKEHAGVQHRLAEIAKDENFKLETTLDPDFEILFPIEDLSIEKDLTEEWVSEAKKLGKKWDVNDFRKTALKIARMESEAHLANISYPRFTFSLCEELARRVSNQVDAVKELILQNIPSDLVIPFLEIAIRRKVGGWDKLALDCLKSDSYSWIAIRILLTTPNLPSDLIEAAIQKAKDRPQLIEHCCMTGEVPESTLKRLFDSNLNGVAFSAAIGHWSAVRREKSTIKLTDQWRKAILQCNEQDLENSHNSYWVGKILSGEIELAKNWLVKQINIENKYVDYKLTKIAEEIIPKLNKDQRMSVLRQIQSKRGHEKIVRLLISDNLDVYRELLSMGSLSDYHLAPLEGPFKNQWVEKALIALDSGYSPEEIYQETFPNGWTWSGPLSRMWDQWVKAFESLENHPDPRIVRIGKLGSENMRERRDRALEKERTESMYGF